MTLGLACRSPYHEMGWSSGTRCQSRWPEAAQVGGEPKELKGAQINLKLGLGRSVTTRSNSKGRTEWIYKIDSWGGISLEEQVVHVWNRESVPNVLFLLYGVEYRTLRQQRPPWPITIYYRFTCWLSLWRCHLLDLWHLLCHNARHRVHAQWVFIGWFTASGPAAPLNPLPTVFTVCLGQHACAMSVTTDFQGFYVQGDAEWCHLIDCHYACCSEG